jgi:septum formation protein
MNPSLLILASSSPRRKELLRHAGVPFETIPSDAAELFQGELTAREMAQINAYRKARSVAKKYPDNLVLGADTLVTLENTVMGKPKSLAAAHAMLEKLQGKQHQVVTAVCLLHLRSHRQRIFCEGTAVTFRALDAEKIQHYIKRVNPLDKAGAYAIQEEGDMIVEQVSGSYTNVVGLPMERLKVELDRWHGTTSQWNVPLTVLPQSPPANFTRRSV